VGLRACLDAEANRKNSLALPGIKTHSTARSLVTVLTEMHLPSSKYLYQTEKFKFPSGSVIYRLHCAMNYARHHTVSHGGR
jgi:hypothetical protein